MSYIILALVFFTMILLNAMVCATRLRLRMMYLRFRVNEFAGLAAVYRQRAEVS